MATYETAKDEYITVTGIQFAYRRLGLTSGTQLVLFPGYRMTMDHWDPALVNALAAQRPVLLIDNAGVARSGGEIPTAISGWAQHYIDVIKALGIQHIDVLGFSMGGCAAQMVALNAPELVRRVILCGTTPSLGPDVAQSSNPDAFKRVKDAPAEDEAAQRSVFLDIFFAPSQSSQDAGQKSWERIAASRSNRSLHLPTAKSRRQGLGFINFMTSKGVKDGSYERLAELKMPVLIANGADDLLLPVDNSILLWQKLRHAKAQLHLYPDSGHAFLFQYAEEFSTLVNDFLNRPSEPKRASRL